MLLLGSIAPATAAGGDIDVCDALGLSGVTISADDNCLVITGKTNTFQYDIGGYNVANGDSGFGPASATIKLHPNTMSLSANVAVYGGVVAPGTVVFTTPDDLNAGPLFDVEGGLNFGTFFNRKGMETGTIGVVVDASHSTREFTAFPGDYIDWTSGTAGLRYTDYLNSTFGLFLGGGGGVVDINERYPTGGSGLGPTVYAEAGAVLKMTDMVSFVVKGEYQGMPMAIKASNGFDVQTSQARLEVGLQLSTPAPHVPTP